MDVMEVDDVPAAHLALLNEDVLFEIFKFLSVCDRKNAKSVCKQWLQVCRCKRFADEQVISISYFYDYSLIKQIIDNFSEERLSLRFTYRRFTQRSLEFWNEYGTKIESLQFFQCNFSLPSPLKHILRRCVNLRELSLVKCKMNRHKEEIFLTKHKNLVVLHLDQNSNAFCLTKEDLSYITHAIPNLRSLKILLRLDFTCNENFSTLLNLLGTKFEHLETVHIHFPFTRDDFPLTLSTLQKLVPTNRLKNVSMSAHLGFHAFAALSYRFWSSMTLENNEITNVALIDRILESPVLQKLEFGFKLTTVDNFRILWSALIKSRLRVLNIKISHDVPKNAANFIHAVDLLMSTLTKNTTVRCLRITTEYSELCSLFAKYFPTVDDLYLETVELKNHSWYPVELMSLSMNVSIIEANSTREELKISIESLEFLNIQYCILELFCRYKFPNLKYLDLDFHHYGRGVRWECVLLELKSILTRESPKLEGIMFRSRNFGRFEYQLCLGFAREFQNLRHIHLLCTSQGSMGAKRDLLVDVTELCQQYSSLKAVSIRTQNFRLYYFYNPISEMYELLRSCCIIADSPTFHVDLKNLWHQERSGIKSL